MRIEDTPELFGVGAGSGTCGDITCEWCGQKYNEGNDAAEDWDGDSVVYTEFAGKTVCECCFEKVEDEVLRRLPDAIPWYSRLLARKKDFVDGEIKKVESLHNNQVSQEVRHEPN